MKTLHTYELPSGRLLAVAVGDEILHNSSNGIPPHTIIDTVLAIESIGVRVRDSEIVLYEQIRAIFPKFK